MSTILSDGRSTAQNPGNNGQICDTKLTGAQCNNEMNDELATLKNEIKQLRKQIIYWFIATLVIITAVFVASVSLTTLHKYVRRISQGLLCHRQGIGNGCGWRAS